MEERFAANVCRRSSESGEALGNEPDLIEARIFSKLCVCWQPIATGPVPWPSEHFSRVRPMMLSCGNDG